MLLTKLHRPPLSLEHVFRFRLIDELNKNMYKPFSLVCAPAGYGKSMLVSSWIEENKHPAAWLSLSSDENDYRTFLIYMIAAIRKVFPGKLEKAEALVKAPELPDNKSIAHSLINELDQIQVNYIVVLDDYHLIRNDAIHQLIDELLRYPPENLHLCMLTRRDPPIRIENLRAHNRMIEIRMRELTFTEEEIIGLFYKLHGIKLERSLAASLQKRTEGWITALQLISLASKNKPNIENELSSFTGDLNTLSDFLIEEILSGLSDDMKELLFSTALLNRYCLELVKACFQPKEDDNSDFLKTETLFDQLINSNFFLIPLDDKRKWFRYHHLFQKTLVTHLGSRFDTERIKRVHYLAAKWFENQGLIEEALGHMIKSGKYEEAAIIIKINAHDEFLKNVGKVETWLNKLPLDVKENSPSLQLVKAWHAFGQFHLEEIPPILEKVNILIKDTVPDPHLSSELYFFQGNFQYWTGDTEGSIQSFDQSLKQCDHLHEHVRCNIELLRYLALQRKGNYNMAVTDLNSRIKRTEQYTRMDIAYYWGSLAFVHLLAGELRSALDAADQMQMFTKKIGANFLLNWSFYLQALVNLQLFQLDKAFDHFEVTSEKHYVIDTIVVFDSKVSLALIHQLNGKSKEAFKIISATIDYAKVIGDPVSLLLVQSAQSRIAILQGDIQAAFQWADTFNEPPSFAGMFFWQENPHMTKAKVFIAKGTPECLQKAEEILITMLDIASSSHLDCQLVEINLLLSLALEKMGQKKASMEKLKTSVILAEKHGFIRPFIEAGKSAMVLLDSLREKGVASDFIDEIDKLIIKVSDKKDSALHKNIEVSEKVVLTERELETLELLATGLKNKEIANALFVSEGTIKKHTYNMGKKFNTSSRVSLLNRARELGLI
ncbi:LuxR C-terminal-related transcriptional regulator [uncultured Eudoraea sp.]|uniref:LuxR C-terminal-related transcriptional regulator n=1 Tax=uncultured Eudoraea sp. TaxID=1035614 RepID=UPI00262E4D7F|nr:LuxR C-terminal-related transcriptional regulator [uncultured Eudoraea sp.]